MRTESPVGCMLKRMCGRSNALGGIRRDHTCAPSNLISLGKSDGGEKNSDGNLLTKFNARKFEMTLCLLKVQGVMC